MRHTWRRGKDLYRARREVLEEGDYRRRWPHWTLRLACLWTTFGESTWFIGRLAGWCVCWPRRDSTARVAKLLAYAPDRF